MNINVPFVKKQKKWKGKGWCGPIALASILRYYKDKSSVEKIVKTTRTIEKKGTCPRGLAFFCLLRGFKVEYLDKYPEIRLNRKEYSKRFKEFLKDVREVENDSKFRKKCEMYSDYKFIKKRPTLKQIQNYLRQEKPVILYLNIGVVCGNNKFWPHYIAVVGFDNKNFYVHNTHQNNQSYQRISKKIFEKAWNSDGMERTLIIPYK